MDEDIRAVLDEAAPFDYDAWGRVHAQIALARPELLRAFQGAPNADRLERQIRRLVRVFVRMEDACSCP